MIFVGPEEFKFYAHLSALSQSPVFKTMCTSQAFPESKSKEIRLPEDHAQTIAVMIEFLYSGDWNSFPEDLHMSDEQYHYHFEQLSMVEREEDLIRMMLEDSTNGLSKVANHLQQWVDMYVLADKYQIDCLKAAVSSKFRVADATVWGEQEHKNEKVKKDKTKKDKAKETKRLFTMELTEAAQRLYNSVSEVDHSFREFFRGMMSRQAYDKANWENLGLADAARGGGSFAEDVASSFFQAAADVYEA